MAVRTCIRSLAPPAEAPASEAAPEGARAEPPQPPHRRSGPRRCASARRRRALRTGARDLSGRATRPGRGDRRDGTRLDLRRGGSARAGGTCVWRGCHAGGARVPVGAGLRGMARGRRAPSARRPCRRRGGLSVGSGGCEVGGPRGAAIEALRLAGIALLALGREDEALLLWKEAVEFGIHTHVQRCDRLDLVAEKLVGLLRRHGRMQSAESVEAAVAALRDEGGR